MGLSTDLISQFVKVTNDNTKKKKETTTVYGTVTVGTGSQKYVQIDGAEMSTPVSTSVDVKEGDRVMITIKNHEAIVTGNLTDPSASSEVVGGIQLDTKKITELEVAVANRVTTTEFNAARADITKLQTDTATIQGSLTASKADIDNLKAGSVTVSEKLSANDAAIKSIEANKLDVEAAEATYATVENLNAANLEVTNLKSTYSEFSKTTTDTLSAQTATIAELNTKKLDAESAKVIYANIDFSNIGSAAMVYLYATSGLIENVVVSDGSVTGVLTGVTIRGDTIEGGTIVADKLVIQGEDGLYYKLNTDGITTDAEQTEYNSLNGSVIAAKTITASKINVDDLAAFDATIGGFSITMDALYSGVKESIDNSTQGVYMDREGQFSIGDSDNFIRYFRDGNGNWKLEIAAESILFGGESKSSADDIKALTEHVKIGTYTDQDTGDVQPCVELSEGDSDFKQVITNTSTMFMDGGMVRTKVDTDGVTSENVTVKNEFRQGGYVWKTRANGNFGLTWKGGNS